MRARSARRRTGLPSPTPRPGRAEPAQEEARIATRALPLGGRSAQPIVLSDVVAGRVDPRAPGGSTRRAAPRARSRRSARGSPARGRRSATGGGRTLPAPARPPPSETSRASSSPRATRRRVSCRPSPSVTSRRKTCPIARRPSASEAVYEAVRAGRRGRPSIPPISRYAASVSRSPSRRSNSSVSANCSSGSAPGWCATSAIISATRPGSRQHATAVRPVRGSPAPARRRCSGGTVSVRVRQQLAEPRVDERPVVEVRPERHDHPEPAVGIERRDAERFQEAARAPARRSSA